MTNKSQPRVLKQKLGNVSVLILLFILMVNYRDSYYSQPNAAGNYFLCFLLTNKQPFT